MGAEFRVLAGVFFVLRTSHFSMMGKSTYRQQTHCQQVVYLRMHVRTTHFPAASVGVPRPRLGLGIRIVVVCYPDGM